MIGQDLEGVLCPTCWHKMSSRLQRQTTDNSSGEEPEVAKRALATESIDTTAGALGMSPLKLRKVRKEALNF